MNRIKINVNSEIGELKGVILHRPGKEVEDMTPQHAERALYSDILNLSVASEEYKEFHAVLSGLTATFEVSELLGDILADSEVQKNLLSQICANEGYACVSDALFCPEPKILAKQLIEGVPVKKDNLTKFLSEERYALQPLHNFFFTRDASITTGNKVLIAKMASKVREREALIMEAIFNHHPMLKTETYNPIQAADAQKITLEGGDILIARDDVLVIGTGVRTTTQGVDYIIEEMKQQKVQKHIIVQELPHTPESFIHLDMVFTFIDHETCLIYKPVVLNPNRYRTVFMTVDNGKVKTIREEENIISALKKVGMDCKTLRCGGNSDEHFQEREQWHSGANFFAVAPGKILGYGRNSYTMDELDRNGYEIISAAEVLAKKKTPGDYERYVITIHGAELARGGGGCRCMTMPIARADL